VECGQPIDCEIIVILGYIALTNYGVIISFRFRIPSKIQNGGGVPAAGCCAVLFAPDVTDLSPDKKTRQVADVDVKITETRFIVTTE
jgi:hypothetical protein